jgi:hypothetical protein
MILMNVRSPPRPDAAHRDRANARELYADMTKAVSRLLAQHPDLMRRAAKDLKSGVPTSDVLLGHVVIEIDGARRGQNGRNSMKFGDWTAKAVEGWIIEMATR